MVGHQQINNFEKFYGIKVCFHKGRALYKLHKLVQTPNFLLQLMP